MNPFKEISFIRRSLSPWARTGDLGEIDEGNSFSVATTRRELGQNSFLEEKQGQQLDFFRLLSEKIKNTYFPYMKIIESAPTEDSCVRRSFQSSLYLHKKREITRCDKEKIELVNRNSQKKKENWYRKTSFVLAGNLGAIAEWRQKTAAKSRLL